MPKMFPSTSKTTRDAFQPTIATNRDFSVLSQSVFISQIDFDKKSFAGYTEISIVPLCSELRKVTLNVGNDVKLSLDMLVRSQAKITVDDYDADYDRKRPMQSLHHTATDRTSSNDLAQAVAAALASKEVDCEQGGGEIVINLPMETWTQADARKLMKIGIDFIVENPQNGVHFVTGCAAERDVTSQHLYTYRSSLYSNTKSWLPCVDASNELCMWRFDITCETMLTAVASGELLETEFTPDLQHKTYQFQLAVPTSAVNIGFAVGHFNIDPSSEMAEVTSFCPVGLLPLVKHCSSTIEKLIEFFEELLSCRYPYGSYKQVFVDELPDDTACFAGLTIASLNILYNRKMLDLVASNRTIQAMAMAQQFFGCFVSANGFLDVWLVRSLSRYMTGLFIQRYFGHNEYMYHTYKTLQTVCEYEAQWGPIVLRPLASELRDRFLTYFDPRCADVCSAHYGDVMTKKGHFVLRMLEIKLGKESMLQVLRKIAGMATQAAGQKFQPATWQQMTVSTDSFLNAVINVTGSEIERFNEQWISGRGHAHFKIDYSFNRKRNMVELEVYQEPLPNNSRQMYTGPLSVTLQEVDGAFVHNIQIDDSVEMDLTQMEPDSPVLWIRVDPLLSLVCSIEIQQPVCQWEYQLRFEKDIVAQFSAIEVLPRFPSQQVKATLLEVLESPTVFYRVRVHAAYCLADICNRMAEAWQHQPLLINLFKKWFGCQSCPSIPKPNNYALTANSLQSYFVMQAFPLAMAKLRTANQQACLRDVHTFLLGLIRYADDFYRASLLSALANSITQKQFSAQGTCMTPDDLSKDMAAVLTEFTLALNLDNLKPSYSRRVSVSALRGIYQLQKKGHLPVDAEVFWQFAQSGLFSGLRCAALECLVDLANWFRSPARLVELLDRLFSIVDNEVDMFVRVFVAKMLSQRPPFAQYVNCLTGPDIEPSLQPVTQLMHRIRTVILLPNTNCRLRRYLLDCYHILYELVTAAVAKASSLDTIVSAMADSDIHITYTIPKRPRMGSETSFSGRRPSPAVSDVSAQGDQKMPSTSAEIKPLVDVSRIDNTMDDLLDLD